MSSYRDAPHPLGPANEEAWLARKAEIYRKLSLAERIAWFRDLEWIAQVFAGAGGMTSEADEPDIARRGAILVPE